MSINSKDGVIVTTSSGCSNTKVFGQKGGIPIVIRFPREDWARDALIRFLHSQLACPLFGDTKKEVWPFNDDEANGDPVFWLEMELPTDPNIRSVISIFLDQIVKGLRED